MDDETPRITLELYSDGSLWLHLKPGGAAYKASFNLSSEEGLIHQKGVAAMVSAMLASGKLTLEGS